MKCVCGHGLKEHALESDGDAYEDEQAWNAIEGRPSIFDADIFYCLTANYDCNCKIFRKSFETIISEARNAPAQPAEADPKIL